MRRAIIAAGASITLALAAVGAAQAHVESAAPAPPMPAEVDVVNVHNLEYGGGALRGQLSTAYTPPRPLGSNCTEVCTDGGAGTTPLG
jgi:hypothetical protein